ncbi:MAG: 4a-hydroxytetrahydrobiopterin dehydratase [Thiolinea sp.]
MKTDIFVSYRRDNAAAEAHSITLPPDPIDEDKLTQILEKELPRWSRFSAPLPEKPEQVRSEISREFKFDSFQSAINFMSEVAPGCDIASHHPRWENIWKTLTVFLSTWDGELHKVTDRDVMLAKYFDRAYGEFAGRSGKN